jgi:spore coat polysaccharide biosynthesis protein SpsF
VKVVGIIQARAGSTRLPRKVLAKIADKTLLEHVIARLKTSKVISEIVVAVPNTIENREIIDLAKKNNVSYFAGDEENVLLRFVEAAKKFNADVIVRVGADVPFISIEGINKAVNHHITKEADYTFNKFALGVKNGYPLGTGTEIISRKVLEKVNQLSNEPDEREHVTLFVRRNSPMFKIEKVEAPREMVRPNFRLTVDAPEDLTVIKEIFKQLYQPGKVISAIEAIRFLDANPRIVKINQNIEERVKE